MAADNATTGEAQGGGQLAYPRHEQTFLTAAEIERLRRFGEVRTYRDGAAGR